MEEGTGGEGGSCDGEKEHGLMGCADKSSGLDGARIVGAEVTMGACMADDIGIGVYSTLTSGSMIALIENCGKVRVMEES